MHLPFLFFLLGQFRFNVPQFVATEYVQLYCSIYVLHNCWCSFVSLVVRWLFAALLQGWVCALALCALQMCYERSIGYLSHENRFKLW